LISKDGLNWTVCTAWVTRLHHILKDLFTRINRWICRLVWSREGCWFWIAGWRALAINLETLQHHRLLEISVRLTCKCSMWNGHNQIAIRSATSIEPLGRHAYSDCVWKLKQARVFSAHFEDKWLPKQKLAYLHCRKWAVFRVFLDCCVCWWRVSAFFSIFSNKNDESGALFIFCGFSATKIWT